MLKLLVIATSVVATLLVPSCGEESEPVLAADEQKPIVIGQRSPATTCEPGLTCFRDTARVRDIDTDPGSVVDAEWMVFANAGDSLEIDAGVGDRIRSDAYVTTVFEGRVVQERNAKGNTAAWTRLRASHAGVARIAVSLDDMYGDTVPYLLRIKRISADAGRQWAAVTGERAGIEFTADNTTRIAVIPLSVAAAQRQFANWALPPRSYRVALVADAQYVVCQLPCTRRDTITLRPGDHVTRRY